MTAASALVLIVSLLATPPGEIHPVQPAHGFADVRHAPADITLYLHIEGAAALRQQIANRPIANWVNQIVNSGHMSAAWVELARAANVPQETLFDQFLGKRFTLMARESVEWTVMTEVDEARGTKFVQQMRARVREPRHGMAIVELPEQELLLARFGNTMVIGPSKHSALFYELLPTIEKMPDKASFDEASLARANELGSGPIAVLIKHEPPMGGFSAAVANLQGDQLTLRHVAKFEHAPFTHAVTQVTCDFAPVMQFEDRALIAVLQPTDVDDGPVEAFLTANLGEGLMSGPMRKNMGDRRLVVFGEVDGRQQPEPDDLLSTTVTACVQVKDCEIAVEQLDHQMIRITDRLNEMNKGSLLIQAPAVRQMNADQMRHVSIGGEAGQGWLTGGFPVMKNVSLNWTVANGPHGAWFVVGSHPQSLDEVASTLRTEPKRPLTKSPAALVGKFDSCGVSNGIRLGRHLRNWSDHADRFAEPEHVAEFQAALQMMSDLAAGMQNCRWQLARPSQNEMRLDVQIRLAPAESAQSE